MRLIFAMPIDEPPDEQQEAPHYPIPRPDVSSVDTENGIDAVMGTLSPVVDHIASTPAVVAESVLENIRSDEVYFTNQIEAAKRISDMLTDAAAPAKPVIDDSKTGIELRKEHRAFCETINNVQKEFERSGKALLERTAHVPDVTSLEPDIEKLNELYDFLSRAEQHACMLDEACRKKGLAELGFESAAAFDDAEEDIANTMRRKQARARSLRGPSTLFGLLRMRDIGALTQEIQELHQREATLQQTHNPDGVFAYATPTPRIPHYANDNLRHEIDRHIAQMLIDQLVDRGTSYVATVAPEQWETATPLTESQIDACNDAYIRQHFMKRLAAHEREIENNSRNHSPLSDAEDQARAVVVLKQAYDMRCTEQYITQSDEDNQRVRELEEAIEALPMSVRRLVQDEIRDEISKSETKGFSKNSQYQHMAELATTLQQRRATQAFQRTYSALLTQMESHPLVDRGSIDYTNRSNIGRFRSDLAHIYSHYAFAGEDVDIDRWQTFRADPDMQHRFDEKHLADAHEYLGARVLRKLLHPRDVAPRLHAGRDLLAFSQPQFVPYVVMNAYRESGFSGENPFIRHDHGSENSLLYRYIAQISPAQIEELRERNIPGLIEVIDLARSNPTDFLVPMFFDENTRTQSINPVHEEIRKNVAHLALHFLGQGDADEQRFVLGVLGKVLGQDLGAGYDALRTIVGTTNDSTVRKEAIELLVEKSCLGDEKAIHAVFDSCPTLSSEEQKKYFSRMYLRFPDGFTSEQRTRLSEILGIPEQDLDLMRAFLKATSIAGDENQFENIRRCACTPGVLTLIEQLRKYGHTFNYFQFEAIPALLSVSDLPGLLDALSEYGYQFRIDHADILPRMEQQKESLLNDLKVVRESNKDFVFDPISVWLHETHRTYIYNPYEIDALQQIKKDIGEESEVLLKKAYPHYKNNRTRLAITDRFIRAGHCYDDQVLQQYLALYETDGDGAAQEYLKSLTEHSKRLIGASLPTEERARPEYMYMVKRTFPSGNYSTHEKNVNSGDKLEHIAEYRFDHAGYPAELTGLHGYRLQDGKKEDQKLLEHYQRRLDAIRTFITSRGPDNAELQKAFDEKVNVLFGTHGHPQFRSISDLTVKEKMLALFITETVRKEAFKAAQEGGTDAVFPVNEEILDLIVMYKYAYHENLEAYVQRSADAVKRFKDDVSQRRALWNELSTIYGENVKHVLRNDIFEELAKEGTHYDTLVGTYGNLIAAEREEPQLSEKQLGRLRRVFADHNIDNPEQPNPISPEKRFDVLRKQLYGIYSANISFASSDERTVFDTSFDEIIAPCREQLTEERMQSCVPALFRLRNQYRYAINEKMGQLFSSDINAILAEVAKYEEVIEIENKERRMNGPKDKASEKSAKIRKIRGYITKTQETANARMGAYLCIAGDASMWENQNYFELVMKDEDTGKCTGLVMMLRIQATDGKKYLWFGPNPFESFLDQVSSEQCYDYLYKTTCEFADQNGFDGVVVPSRDEQILGQCTNRGGDFPDLIKRSRLRDKQGNVAVVPFGSKHMLSASYGFEDGALIWKRSRNA